jgi:Xaa-Pro aminopeptidase
MSSERRKRLWSQLDNKKVDALLITSGETIRYITGFTGSESVLLVSRRGGCLIVDSRYTSQARLECKRMAIKESRNKFKGFVAAAAQRGFKKIGFDPHQLTVSHYRELKKEGTFGLVELAENIEAIRSVKDAGELKLLKKAADISSNSFLDVLDEIRPGVREEAIALSLEYKIKKNGAETTPFPLIVTSGKRGALPHGLATDKKVRKGVGHGTGHGVGLAVHEEPRIAPHQEAIIEKDMVFTIEPGVYIPGWGGVRIEDTVRVTRGGCEPVSSVSKELYCI